MMGGVLAAEPGDSGEVPGAATVDGAAGARLKTTGSTSSAKRRSSSRGLAQSVGERWPSAGGAGASGAWSPAPTNMSVRRRLLDVYIRLMPSSARRYPSRTHRTQQTPASDFNSLCAVSFIPVSFCSYVTPRRSTIVARFWIENSPFGNSFLEDGLTQQ